MVIPHSYGKHCSNASAGATINALSVLYCRDRTDCWAVNNDALLMSGYLCHPCLPNICDEGDICENVPFEGARCIQALMTVTMKFDVTDETLDAMLADPAAAVRGLERGLANALGVEERVIVITRTVPDLLGGRRLAEGRRARDSSLEVELDLYVAGDAEAVVA